MTKLDQVKHNLPNPKLKTKSEWSLMELANEISNIMKDFGYTGNDKPFTLDDVKTKRDLTEFEVETGFIRYDNDPELPHYLKCVVYLNQTCADETNVWTIGYSFSIPFIF